MVVCFAGREGRQEQIKIAEGGQKVEKGIRGEGHSRALQSGAHNGLLLFSMQEFKEKEIEVKWMSSSLIV